MIDLATSAHVGPLCNLQSVVNRDPEASDDAFERGLSDQLLNCFMLIAVDRRLSTLKRTLPDICRFITRPL